MKIYRFAILSLLVGSGLWFACKEPAPQISIFGEELRLASEVSRRGQDRRLLDVIHVEEIYYNVRSELTSGQMESVASALLSKASPAVDGTGVVFALVYTTDESGAAEAIELETTHAFSTFSATGEGLAHRYYEKQASSFVEVPTLTHELQGGFSFDDVRMLHFAASGENGLPARSTVYEFGSGVARDVASPGVRDRSLRLALLLDNERYWGASTSGLYGKEIQAALMAPTQPGGGGGGGSCGFTNPGSPQLGVPTDPSSGCPQGADACYMDPVAGTKMFCGGGNDTGCFAAMASNLVAADRQSDAETIDFTRLWQFQDDFMLRYPIGKDYVAAYLVISLFLELDEESMQLALAILPDAYAAMDQLQYGEGDELVVTPEFFSKTTEVIESMRGVENPIYQGVLDRLQDDLNTFNGMTKKELVGEFESRRSVPLSRPGLEGIVRAVSRSVF